MGWAAFRDLYHIQLGKDQGFKLIDLADLDPAVFHLAAKLVITHDMLCCPAIIDGQHPGSTWNPPYEYHSNSYCQAFAHFFKPNRSDFITKWFGEFVNGEEQKSREMALTIMGEMVQNAKDQREALLKRKR